MVEFALDQGVFAEAVRPPAVPEGTARVRVSVMASHQREELREAAVVLGRAALRAGFRPGAGVPVAAAHGLLRRRVEGRTPAPMRVRWTARPGVRSQSFADGSFRPHPTCCMGLTA